MSNEKSMTNGGTCSAIGPALMKKAMPFRRTVNNMAEMERNVLKDNSFRGVGERIRNLSFAADFARHLPEFRARVQTVGKRLNQAASNSENTNVESTRMNDTANLREIRGVSDGVLSNTNRNEKPDTADNRMAQSN